MRRVALLMAAVGVAFAGVIGSALGASSVFLCVPTAASEAVTSGGSTGTCSGGARSVALPSEKAEQEKLISILPYINYEASGVDEKPTIQFSGANLQVINGSGSETTVNGTGNLILGYDETPGKQSGSHNLLLGASNSYTSYGGIIAGHANTISSGYASIVGGQYNTAAGYVSTITGGYSNKASANDSAIGGGCSNTTGSIAPTINTSCTNTTLTGDFSAVQGGTGNQAEAENSTVSGGTDGEASGVDASVTGGSRGKAGYRASTVLGGLEEVSQAEFEVTP